MPINSQHPLYDTHDALVCNDAYEGNVKDYVATLTRQTPAEYNAYVGRGVYFNATKPTTEGLIGVLCRKPYTTDIKVMPDFEELTADQFVTQLARKVILGGRAGILVDWDEQEQNTKFVSYSHEQIVNWRKESDVLILVVLMEQVILVDSDDKYQHKITTQYRELYLENGVYAVNVWRKKDLKVKDSPYVIVETYTPSVRGSTLNYIPFTFCNPFDVSTDVHKPVILPIAQLNISHFKTTVDLEHAVHFVALPTPWIAGDIKSSAGTETPTEMSIGVSTVWLLEQGATVGYLEFTGAGISSLEHRLNVKENQMIQIGSRLITEKKGIESVEALRMRSASDTASLVSIVGAMENCIINALTTHVMWTGQPEEFQFELNRDFVSQKLEPQEVEALMKLYMAGIISQETMLENLFTGEIAPEVQVEMERLAEQAEPVNNPTVAPINNNTNVV